MYRLRPQLATAGFFMTDRLRGRALQERRARVLSARPLCVDCEARGRVRPATEVDHVVALVNGGTDTEDNLQGLCAECHAAKTARDLGHRPKGCDARGLPLDAAHHWR